MSFQFQDDVIHKADGTGDPGQQVSRGELMKNMGQLWLAAEVRDLECRVRGRPALSAYLVLDTDALILHTNLVKQLVFARKFIVVVPAIGMYRGQKLTLLILKFTQL